MRLAMRSHAGRVILLLSCAAAQGADLEQATLRAWEEYTRSATSQMEQRVKPGTSFLWMDEMPDRRHKVRAGEVVVSPIGPQVPMRIASGLIHHWVGTVFVPQVTLDKVLAVVGDYSRYKEFYAPTVVDSKAVVSGDGQDRFSMRLMNKSFVLTTAFDADYESCYVRLDSHHGYTVSRTTRVQEVEQYGSPSQRALAEGAGSGIIWRLFSITRFLERDGGVYIEIEAIGLSRDIPASMRWLMEPIVRRVSRSSIATCLRQTEMAVHNRQAEVPRP
jgi:hypothetical protein